MELLYQNLPGALLSSLIVATLLAYLQTTVINPVVVWSWLAVLVAISFARYILTLNYSRAQNRTFEASKTFELKFFIGVIAAALTWGSAGILLFPAESHATEHQFFLAFALGGISAGSIVSLSPVFKHTITFVSITLLPLTASLAFGESNISIVESLMVLLFAIMLIVISMKMSHALEAMFLIKEEAEIKAKKAAEQKRLFELVLENIPSRIFWKDKDLRYMGANHHFMKETKLPPGISIVGMTDHEMPWAKRYEEFLATERNIVDGKQGALHFEEFSKTMSGEERWLEISKLPILNDQHEAEGILGIFQDITKRKQAENLLRLAATAFETHEAISITDQTGTIISVNKAFTEITGYTPEEVIGEKPSILSSGKHDVNFFANMWAGIIKDGRWKGEVINRRKDGAEYTELLTITAVKDDYGEVTNYVGVFSDVSEKKDIERQLRQSQKMDAIGTLVSGIAHEFNNMLVGISGNIFLSKVKVAPESEIYQMLDTADDICFKAADMVKQLLTFARKDDAIQHLKVLDMSEWLTEGIKLAQSSIPATTKLVCNNEEEKLMVSADTTQLQQLIINLLNNARDASAHRDKPRVEVTLSSGSANEAFRKANNFSAVQFVKLTVRDNGTGIPEDKIDKIFEPFYTTKDVGKGTGLGMAVIQGIAHSHNACIQVESTVGEGTAIHILFPRVLSKHSSEEAPVKANIIHGNGETILIADDEAEVLMVTTRLLHNLGYKVVEASCGEEAVEKFRETPESFDLVFLDIIMPGLTGPSAAHQIRAIRPDVPIAFYTGYGEDEILEEMRKLDGFKLITKPYRINEVSMLLHSMLAK